MSFWPGQCSVYQILLMCQLIYLNLEKINERYFTSEKSVRKLFTRVHVPTIVKSENNLNSIYKKTSISISRRFIYSFNTKLFVALLYDAGHFRI